jgi:hypothetical protein
MHADSRMLAVMMCVASSLGLATPADAQTRCPEGKTASGKCINPVLGQMGRQTMLVMTQTKFSYTAPPYLPIDDRTSRIPAQSHELYNLYTYPPLGKPITIIPGGFHGGPPNPYQLFRP